MSYQNDSGVYEILSALFMIAIGAIWWQSVKAYEVGKALYAFFMYPPLYKAYKAAYEIEFLYPKALCDCGIYSSKTCQKCLVFGKGFYVPERVLSTELQPFRGFLHYFICIVLYKT